MKAAGVLSRDVWFYPLVLAAWGTFLLVRHANYEYFGTPRESVPFTRIDGGGLADTRVAHESIRELHESFASENDEVERGHIHHNIGTVYYDLYKQSNQGHVLDSARVYFERSLERVTTVARLHYNLGRVHTELRNHGPAKACYEQALRLDPDHILALHNLGLLNHFELGRSEVAAGYLRRALAIRPHMPIANFVLGDIALTEGEYRTAATHFTREIETCHRYRQSPMGLPVSAGTTTYALAMSHRRLAVLFSTKLINKGLAQRHLHAYLRLEQNPQKRKKIMREMKRHWVVQ
jgi:tetratricopeptide (TPR) repeat protein